MAVEQTSTASSVILVVEDEALIRMLLVDAMEDAGFTVVEANGADAAIATFGRRRDISAVVTDVRMPGSMDGIGLAGWMREHVPGVPIIICSGMDTRIDLTITNPAIVRVVSKPYMPDDIASFVAALAR